MLQFDVGPGPSLKDRYRDGLGVVDAGLRFAVIYFVASAEGKIWANRRVT